MSVHKLTLRKIAAILFMLILLFNLCGYRFVIAFLQDNANKKLETKLDRNDYEESQLVEITVPLNMPYQERFTDFERHYGEIEIDGKHYNYVKRKIDGNVVIFKCIVNESKERFTVAKDEMARSGSDMNQPAPSKKSPAKHVISEYDSQQIPLANAFSITSSSFVMQYSASLPFAERNTPHQPPEC